MGLWGAGESSRCEDDTRPYSRHCGEIVGGITTPDPHLRPADNNGNGVEADNDAARRIATSFEKLGESVLNRRIPKGNRGERPVWVQSFIGYGVYV